MSHDLTEQALREQLHVAAEAQSGSYVDVDPLTALDTGRRVLRRRRITAAAGTAAAAMAIGVGSWAVLSERDGEDHSLPAVTTSVTGPSVTLDLGTDAAFNTAEPVSVVVTVAETSGKVEFRLRTATGTVLESAILGATGSQAPWAALAPNVMAAVVPAEAAAFVPLWSSAVTEQQAATEVLPDGRVAAAWRTDVPATGAQFAGLIWTDGASATTAAGEELSSVVVDDSMVIFANNRSGAFGYLRPEAGSTTGSGAVGQAREQQTGGPLVGVWAPDASGDSGTYVVYLPPIDDALAAQAEILTTPGATVRDVSSYFPNGNARLVVAHVDGTPDAIIGLTFPGLEDWPAFG